MEGVETKVAPPPLEDSDEDFSCVLVSQFRNSSSDQHRPIRDAIGAISQALKDEDLPLNPLAYLDATCSSIDRLSSSSDLPSHHLDALFTIMFLTIDRLPSVVIETKYTYLSELLIRILGGEKIGIGNGGAAAGLKCASRLLIARGKVAWADVEELYGLLISFITDDRIEVREQSHSCVCEVLVHFQSVPALATLLAHASEAITNLFEGLARGSNAKDIDVFKAEKGLLYVLDALKFCLPCISSKSLTCILMHFKSLLDRRHPLVTRHITDGLNALCLHSGGGVSAEVLLDLLCSVATSVSQCQSSADGIAFTARLLDTGMKRVYLLNKDICVAKLPSIFVMLKDILTSGHEEASTAAVATYRSLIHSCLDESLIKLGVDQITVGADSATRKSGPTVIEKVCATIESLLNYHHESLWNLSFQIISAMFDKLGKYSFYLMTGTLKSLADLQKLPDGFALRKQLLECMGTALRAMGPQNFLTLLPINLEVLDQSESNLWLFPILKQYTIGSQLSFFSDSILPMVGLMKRKSAVLAQEGKVNMSRSIDGIVYSLWSLLPSFCNYPVDTAQSLKGLERTLCTALEEEPDVRGIICSSLQTLIQQNKRILDSEGKSQDTEISVPEQKAIALYSEHFAGSNLSTLRSSAKEFLSILTAIYFKSSKDIAGILQSTIRELASIADKEVVTQLFKKCRKRLVVIQEASTYSNLMQVDNSSNEGSLSAARAKFFDLAISLLPGLDSKEIDSLLLLTIPGLKDEDDLIQKKAYKVLSLLVQYSHDFVSRKLEEVLTLMIELLPSCHFSARCYRLDCLYFLIVHVSKEGSEQRRNEVFASFLAEIILSLKEVNKKTRSRACDILVHIGHAFQDEKDGNNEKLHQYFNMVAGGLAGETPHMISAATTALARLAYEFSDLVPAAYNVLPSTFLLMQRKNKEIIKANLGFLKALVAKSQAESLQTHLRNMVEGLLNCQDFKSKVKLLLEMLVEKCGLDAVKEVMPEEHMKLLTNIRKLKVRNERKLTANSIDDRRSRWGHTKMSSDFEGKGSMNKAIEKSISSWQSKRKRKVSKSLLENSFDHLDDEPLDLLDCQRMRSALRLSEAPVNRKSYLDDEACVDSEGRLIIIEEDGKNDRKQKQELFSSDGWNEGRSLFSHKRRKTFEHARRKTGGDVRQNDKLEPYSYWSLDRRMMSRKPEHRAAARKGMASAVKLKNKLLQGKSVSNALCMGKET